MTYLEDFFDRSQKKSFFTNLMKYDRLDKFGKEKCITSFLTHLIIDLESGILNEDFREENQRLQKEVLLILNDIMLYDNDYFFNWLKEKIS